MHQNYYLFERQVFSLNRLCISSRIAECFTHRKDELVIALESGEKSFLRIGIGSQTPYILLFKAHVIRDPHTYFFKELLGKKINGFMIIPYDKIVYITVDNFFLKCVFFGKERNISLLDSEKRTIQTFKKSKNSLNSHSKDFPSESVSPLNLKEVKRENPRQELRSFLMTKVGGFNKLLAEEVCFRANLNPEVVVSELNDRLLITLDETVSTLLNEFKEEEYFLYEHPQEMSIMSLSELKHLDPGYNRKTFHDVNTLWKQYLYQFQQINSLNRILNRCRDKIAGRIKYLEKTLKKVSAYQELEEKKKLSELKGHLLQTYSAEIKKGAEKVNLKNIYSDDGKQIAITLDPKLSIQENALKYFNKYKNIAELKGSLEIKKDTLQHELNYWNKKYVDTEKINNLKKAEQLEQLLSQKKLIQRDIRIKKPESVLDSSSFNRMILKQQWEIFIGKNSENNDLLTFKFARKYDIWLHAQGVSGSHVIIRVRDKNQKPPMDIIEQAASVAAFFSAGKNSSTVPVNYTEVRYVRKPRKSPPGTVIFSHPNTIFVEPRKYI